MLPIHLKVNMQQMLCLTHDFDQDINARSISNESHVGFVNGYDILCDRDSEVKTE